LWDDEAFYGERPADFRVYYSPDEFINTLHDTTELGIVAPEKREMKLLQVNLPAPPIKEVAEGEPAEEATTVGVGFWYQGIVGPTIPKMDISLVSPWVKQAIPADLPNVDSSTAPLVQLEGSVGSFARVFQLEPGSHTFALEEDAVGGGILNILVEKPPPPKELTEEEKAEKEAAGEPVEPEEVPQPSVTVVDPEEVLPELINLENEHHPIDGYHVFARGFLRFDGRFGPAVLDYWTKAADAMYKDVLRLRIFKIGQMQCDLPEPVPEEPTEPPFERKWPSRAPPIHSPESWTRGVESRGGLELPWFRRSQVAIDPPAEEGGQVVVLVEGLGRLPEGKIHMQMLVRPAENPDGPPAEGEGEEQEPVAPPALELDTLTTTVWSGTAAPSDHNLVLRERIRVLEEDVTVRASLRVAVSDPSINLRCSIQVQHPAFPPVDEAGAVGEPPKATTITAYGRRQHWIDSLETRRVYAGTGEVRIPYICFSPGLVYILHIESTEPIADPESLKWTLHGFYNGEAGILQIGRDTANDELEQMVRDAWEAAEEGRAERAAKLRAEYMEAKAREEPIILSGLKPPVAAEDEDEETAHKREAKAAELAALAELAARTDPSDHARPDVRFFLTGTKEEAQMVMEDPYEVLPLVEETRALRKEHREAVRAGLDAARAEMVEKAIASLEKFQGGLEKLGEWRANADVQLDFESVRGEVTAHLEHRAEIIEKLVAELPAGEAETLDTLLHQGTVYEIWRTDPTLLELGKEKQKLNDTMTRLQKLVDEAKPPEDEGEEPVPPSLEDQAAMADLVKKAEASRELIAKGCALVPGFPISEEYEATLTAARQICEN
jgi:hypothetical protein